MVSLFFNPQGRIGKGPFWMGAIVLIVVSLVLSAVQTYGPPNLGLLLTALGIALIYPGVCVYAKRFHDAGATGWWYLLVVVLSFLIVAGISIPLTLPQSMAAQEQNIQFGSPEFAALQRQMAQDVFLPLMAASLAVGLVAAFIVSMLPSDPGENKFGPPTTGAAPTQA